MHGTDYSCLGSVEEFDEALIVSALHLLKLGSVLIDLEGWHALDSSSCGTLSIGINVNLHHGELWVVGDVTLIYGSNVLAWWAPGGRKVDDKRLAINGSGDGSVEICFIGDVRHYRVEFFCSFFFIMKFF